MTINLLPLALGSRPDPIEYLQRSTANQPKNKAVAQYLRRISNATMNLQAKNQDTGRFLTVFSVAFQSVKKLTTADIITGIDSQNPNTSVAERKVDPNVSHPLRQRDILTEIGTHLHGVKFTSHTLQAIVWKHGLKENLRYCWRSKLSGGTQYARDVLTFIRQLTAADIEMAVRDYRDHLRRRRYATLKREC